MAFSHGVPSNLRRYATQLCFAVAGLYLSACQPCRIVAPGELLTIEAFVAPGGVSLRWLPNFKLKTNSYHVERRPAGTFDFQVVGRAESLVYFDAEASAGIAYDYRVKAHDERYCETIYSQTVAVTVPEAALPVVSVACHGATRRWVSGEQAVSDIRWSNHSDRLSGFVASGFLHFFDADGGSLDFTFFIGQTQTFLGWRFDDAAVAFGGFNRLALHDAADGAMQQAYEYAFGFVGAAGFEPSGMRAAVAGSQRLFSFDLEAGVSSAVGDGHDAKIVAVSWHPERPWVASGDNDGVVVVWDTELWTPVTTVVSFLGGVTQMHWLPSGGLAVRFSDGATRHFDEISWQPLRTWTNGHLNFDGTVVAELKGDGTVNIFDVAAANEICNFDVRDVAFYSSIRWASDRDALAVAGEGLGVWDIHLERD